MKNCIYYIVLTKLLQCDNMYLELGGNFMAKTENINIRIEPSLKRDVEKTLEELGMNIADAVTIFLKQVVLTESIPFMIKKPKFSKDMLEAIAEAEKMEKHPEDYESFETMEELMEDLHKDI